MRWKVILAALTLALIMGNRVAFAEMQSHEAKAQSSIILEVEGVACMGQTSSRDETRKAALAWAKRRAAEDAVTYIKSETRVESGLLMSDLINAYAKARVKIVEQKDHGWVKEESPGAYVDECYRIRIKAEVIPDSQIAATLFHNKAFLEDPRAPLTVRLWTDRDDYRCGEKVRIYLKGNKPFYAVIVYRDVTGNLIQLLPNPYRADNYFKGGVIYELPGGGDRYALEVCPPLGKETVTLYASTTRLGSLQLIPAGTVYTVQNPSRDLGTRTRSVQFVSEQAGGEITGSKAKFAEGSVAVKTSM